MPSPLLSLCARTTSFPELKERIAHHSSLISDWDVLLTEAEQHGLSPLLYWHLKPLRENLPGNYRRANQLLTLRHQHINTVYADVLREVLELLHQADIDVLVLKGAALCHTLYPEIGLRPMRDIDLLIRNEQAQQAQNLLIENGFVESRAPRPTDHFHLPSLHRKVAGIALCIELHTGLFPACPPFYHRHSFDDLFGRKRSFDLDGLQAHCLGDEDMLWHIFEHGLHMPLTYEPFKLIAVADIVTLVETRYQHIDWERMKSEYPRIMAALPHLHHLTPWQEPILTCFSWKPGPMPNQVGETFQGWPQLRLQEQKDRGLWKIIRHTFLPPEWWCRLYYGFDGKWGWLRCLLIEHPRQVFWWVQLYLEVLVKQPSLKDVRPGMSHPILRRWLYRIARIWLPNQKES